MVLLDALYVNFGGGKILLDVLVKALERSGHPVFYAFDERVSSDYQSIPDERKVYLKASLKNRHAFYKTHSGRFSSVLCFGNLPPSVKLSVPVYTYFHNVLYFGMSRRYGWKMRFSFYLKRRVLKKLSKNTLEFWVQSENVKQLIQKNLIDFKNRVWVAPFYRTPEQPPVEKHEKPLAFMYLSDGHPHKNHSVLIESWRILHKKGLDPALHLTISEYYPELAAQIKRLHQDEGLNIINHGFTAPEKLFNQSQYQIYPSVKESYGLGLIESVLWNTDVIASDLPYVQEVITPHSVFDPANPVQLAGIIEHLITNQEEPSSFKSVLKSQNSIQEIIKRLHS